MSTLQKRLRATVKLRTKPTPLAEFIPLCQEAADTIDELLDSLTFVTCCLQSLVEIQDVEYARDYDERAISAAKELIRRVSLGHPSKTRKLDSLKIATILAALRYYQNSPELGDLNEQSWVSDIATNGGEFQPMGREAIDRLCEYINCEEP